MNMLNQGLGHENDTLRLKIAHLLSQEEANSDTNVKSDSDTNRPEKKKKIKRKKNTQKDESNIDKENVRVCFFFRNLTPLSLRWKP